MALMFLFMMCPVGIGVALVRRHARAVPADPAVRDDVPVRLLRWAAGLLPARPAEWARRCPASWATSTAGAGGGASRSAARAPRCCYRPGPIRTASPPGQRHGLALGGYVSTHR
jgi:hypothetical protein